jgi:hypothetical protein
MTVAVALEPVKQDLIDNELLESVPKTMKVKAQLLLKKMKSSLDISWNEKGKLKYKGPMHIGITRLYMSTST